MLQGSILGRLYAWWLCSAAFSLLRRCYGTVMEWFRGSVILGFLFGESRVDPLFRKSRVAGLLDGFGDLLLRLGGGIGKGIWESRICGLARRSIAGSVIFRFEFLFGLFLCVSFAVPHEKWNNLYMVGGTLVFFLVSFLLWGMRREKPMEPHRLGLWFWLFALACVISVLFSANRKDSIRVLLFFLTSFLLCYLIASRFAEPEKLRGLLYFMYVSLVVVGAWGVVQHVFNLVAVNPSFTDVALNKGVPGRVISTLDNPNNLAEFILMFLPLGAALAGSEKRTWLRWLLAGGLVLPMLSMVWTYSRAGWIAMALAVLIFVWCCNKRLIPAFLLLAILAVPFLPDSILVRLSTIGNPADSSASHRVDLWRGVLSLLGSRLYWLTGIGIGPKTFAAVYPEFAVGKAVIGAYHSQMHYLELDLEMGLLGLVSFLALMLKAAGRVGRDSSSPGTQKGLISIACCASLAALAVEGLVEYIWFYQRCMFAFFIFLGILIANQRTAERKNERNGAGTVVFPVDP